MFESRMTRYLAGFKKSALAQATAISVICIAIYFIGPISTYETNDDVGLGLIFSGKLFSSSPDPHVVFINYVLADIFSKLFLFIPDFPWYGVFHLASIIASVFFLNYFFSIARENSKFWLRLAISLSSALPLLFLIQFTKTSFVLAITGYLGLYLLSDTKFRSRLHCALLHATAASFLLLSFSLRKESFLMATILCSFLMARALLKKNAALLLSISASIILILVLSLIHEYNYGGEWRNYLAVQKMVVSFVDYKRIGYEDNKEVFKEAGLSMNDFCFLKLWGHADGKVFGKERLDYILEKSKKSNNGTNILYVLQGAMVHPARDYILTSVGMAILLLLIYRQQYSFLCVFVLLPFLICSGILAWQGRFPPRVSISMVYFVPWALMLQCGEIRRKWLSAAIAVMAVPLLAAPIYGQHKHLSEIAKYRISQNRELHGFGALAAKEPIKLVTLGAGAFPYEGLLPFESPNYLSGVTFIWLCGMNQSPLQKKQFAENDIGDIFAQLVATGNATYINMNNISIPFLQNYILEHYHKKVTATPVYKSNSFIIYQLMPS